MWYVVQSWRWSDGDVVGGPWVRGPFGSQAEANGWVDDHLPQRPDAYVHLESIYVDVSRARC